MSFDRRGRGSDPLRRHAATLILSTFLCLHSTAFAQTDPSSHGLAADSSRVRDPQGWVRTLLGTKRFVEADSVARLLLERAERDHGAESLETARALDLVVEAMGAKATARPFAERAVRIREKLPPNDVEQAGSWENLGLVLMRGGLPGIARVPLEKALQARERSVGKDHVDVAATLGLLAAALMGDGELQAAEPLLERARSIRERELPPLDPLIAESYNDLGNLSTDLGDYERAEDLFKRSLAIRTAALSADHPDLAQSLGNLGRLQYRMGNYVSARANLERAFTIREKTSGPESRGIAFTLHYLGLVSQAAGDYAAAKDYFTRALHMREHLLGMEHIDVAATANALGVLAYDANEYENARVLLERALLIREKALNPQHPQVAVTLHDLADVLGEIGQIAAAESLSLRAISIWHKTYGERHQLIASALTSIGTLHLRYGDAAGARSSFTSALSMERGLLGTEHPDLAPTLVGLAEACRRLGQRREALEDALRAEGVARDHLRWTARALSEREALRYEATRTRGLGIALSIAESGLPDSLNRRVWDALVRSRALVLDEMAERRRVTSFAGDTTSARLAAAVAATSARVASLIVRGPDEGHEERYRRAVAAARQELDTAERELANRHAPFRAARAARSVGLSEVVAAMPHRTALLAFVRYTLPESVASKVAAQEYVAFVLSADSQEVTVVGLGAAAVVDSLVARWLAEIRRGALERGRSLAEGEAVLRKTGERLRGVLWDPLVQWIGSASRVFVVPDATLNLIPLGALPVGPSSYLAEKNPAIHYLSTERDVVTAVNAPPKNDALLAVGGPAFDDSRFFARLNSRHSSAPKSASTSDLARSAVYRGAHSDCLEFRSVRFWPLPASLREAREVATLWSKAYRPVQDVLTGRAATEAAIKSGASRAGVLHFATHGFFIGGRCASASFTGRGIGALWVASPEPRKRPKPSASETDRDAESPFLLAGLALAGANHRDSAGIDEEDGILTAEEITVMDLSGVRWAVLSACDTGVGEITSGEGVFGLRRAFQIAGCGTLFLSLWEVEDNAARQWMRALYRGSLERGLDTADAACHASLSVLRERRAAHESTHPFYWSGFVAAGDWR
jgi:CHAT domain-containing protein/tetratricopeptide (TPR) repeat protein